MRRGHRYALGAKRTGEWGQAIVEFALVFFSVFVVFLAMLEMVFLMYAYNTLTNAAKEGVRVAVVNGSGSNLSISASTALVRAQVQKFSALSMQKLSAANVTVNYPGNCNDPGCLVTVNVAAAYKPFFGLGWPSITINAAADGRIFY
jgi:Flp pilus assembly protein TadG